MLNKRACRAFFDPKLHMPDTGLLHAEQVGFIVRSAIRIIDHHRVLVLYVYNRAEAEQGDFMPLYTVFQDKDDYVTLARQENGSLKWRTACFDKLGGDYWFSSKCAFYSVKDERRVSRYLHDDSNRGGFAALFRAQSTIQARRLKERQISKERTILDRMSVVKALPRGLNGWIRRSIMPAYFLCNHTSAHKPVEGICTSCGHDITLRGAKHNDKAVCPRCHRELTIKSCAKFSYIYDRDTVQVIQRTGPQELVIRIIKAVYTYRGGEIKTSVYENARFFAGISEQGSFYVQNFYFSPKPGILTDWRRGCRPVYTCYQYNFDADTCAHVYCANLQKELAGTPWHYCPVEQFYQHFQEPMELPCFMREFLAHPRLEHLIKTELYNLASDIVYRYNSSILTLDETQNRTHRILGVAAEDVDFLRELDINRDELKRFRELAGVKDRQQLFRWMKERSITRDVPAMLQYVTAHRLMRYVDEQRTNRKPQDTLSEYRDYLEMCTKLDYAAKDKSILYPKDLHAAHDRAAKQVKVNADKLMRRNFITAYKRITGKLDYTRGGMMIVLPASPEELAAEGNALHHCVSSYADRVARQECIVVFVRRAEEPGTPYYTAEVRNGRIVQLRGLGNCAPTTEVQMFADAWQHDVLQSAALPSAA